MITFYLNNELINTAVHKATALLDFLRNGQKLTGTKEGCREGDCGACTVLVGRMVKDDLVYKSVNSCLLPIGDLHGCHVVSVEGLHAEELNPVQSAMVEEGGSQCGFCTPGFVMSMTGFFLNENNPDMEKGIAAIDGNICRCTGYAGIKRALEYVLNNTRFNSPGRSRHLTELIEQKLVPFYFADMPGKLLAIKPVNSTGKSEENTGKTIIGGGTDLFVQRWESLLESSPVFVNDGDISSVITEADGKIVIGAAATVTDFMESEVVKKYYPVIQEKLHLFGSLPIRNRATIAGNIVNASPIADMVNILMTLDASLILRNSAGTLRELPLRKFYLGYKTLAKTSDEIIIAVLTDVPKGNYTYNYEKVSRREYLDIASVNSTMYAELQSGIITTAAVSAGGVAPVTKYLENASAFLKGKTPSQAVLYETVAIALNEVTPISDARGSAEYKKILLGRLIKAHFLIMFAENLQVEAVL